MSILTLVKPSRNPGFKLKGDKVKVEVKDILEETSGGGSGIYFRTTEVVHGATYGSVEAF